MATFLIALSTVLGFAGVTAGPARADSAVTPQSGSFTVTGAGYGHGRGMSQYGAYGAAQRGLTWPQILDFYYPGTTRGALAARATIKVWITADRDSDLRVLPSPGLTLSDADGKAVALPTGVEYGEWRVTRSGVGYALSYRQGFGSWVAHPTPLGTGTWSFSNTAKIIKVALPSGSVREYRGTVALVKRDTGGRTVNRLPMEDYVKSVVPLEIPTSWAPNAVRSQAVAAHVRCPAASHGECQRGL